MSSPLRTFTHSLGPYVLVDGTRVAPDFISLVSGAISNPIDLDESGVPVDGAFPEFLVWTGTRDGGNPKDSETPASCLGWSDETHDLVGSIGKAIESTGKWTELSFSVCDQDAHLYCFQQ